MVSCPVFMEIEDGRVVSVIGDKDDPAYHGYTCRRGRDLPAHLYHPNRLLRPLRRTASGEFESTSPETAISEIADRLRAIVDESGPQSVALYAGTYGVQQPGSLLSGAFLRALGSQMSFNAGPIDQPGKFMAAALHGKWRGGNPAFGDADTWLFVGTNPLVSHLGGLPTVNSAWHLQRARKRGIKLIVIDPRKSEIAEHALIHLQPAPGEDAVIMAGMVRIVLAEGLFDAAFVEQNTRNLDVLRRYVEPFTPEFVAERADISAADLIEATRVFASAATGGASAGTGANMSPRGTLTEYLLACLVTLCGFRLRAGDRVSNPGVLVPGGPRRAQPMAPFPAWGYPPTLRARGLSNTACGLPTGALADEMLLEGEGRIRALICYGGNPLMAWPDQLKTREALEALDLLVVLDPKLTQTGQFADYIIPPKLAPEIPVMTHDFEELEMFVPNWGYTLPYAAYCGALVDPPEGSQLLEEWKFFYLLGREMGFQLEVITGLTRLEQEPPMQVTALDMQKTPTTDELFDIVTAGSRVPLSEIRSYESGRVFEDPDAVVVPREPDCDGFLELGNDEMMRQLDEATRGPLEGDDEFPFRLVSLRTPNVLNSQGRDQEKLVSERPHNPVHMHPADMQALGIEPGTLVSITSRRATIHAVVKESEKLRRGVVSMSHCYGIDLERLGPDGDPGAPQPCSMGLHTGALASADLDYAEPYTGIPRMSAIPVHLAPGPQRA
jgi:anaerobic selenocysteine-containing dehydrogenase